MLADSLDRKMSPCVDAFTPPCFRDCMPKLKASSWHRVQAPMMRWHRVYVTVHQNAQHIQANSTLLCRPLRKFLPKLISPIHVKILGAGLLPSFICKGRSCVGPSALRGLGPWCVWGLGFIVGVSESFWGKFEEDSDIRT